jgi:uncharacterized OB-fold protein
MSENKMNENKMTRPLPRPNTYMNTAPFWDAAKEERLVIQYCNDAGKYQWFPHPVSMYTGKRNLEWREVSGKGALYSWTVTNSAWPGHEERVPYICAYVDLDEGPRMLCNLLNCDKDKVRIGMPVKLVWEKLPDGSNYPAFEPA